MIKIEPRRREFPQKSPIEVIEIPKLSPEEFASMRMRLGVTMQQLTTLTDIGRQRISRIERGDEGSLSSDETGNLFVPRALTMALQGIERGWYRKKERHSHG